MSKNKGNTGTSNPEEGLTRIAIVSGDKCKPKKCKQECKRSCPVVRMGKLCIEVGSESNIAFISETLCIGCGICPKKCPFEAIEIINLPKNLEKDTTHRYGPNSFKLHRLPMPRPGQVLGLVGTNGIGKSTALMVLAGKLKPNLGRFENPPDWQEILTYFRGSDLQNFFTKLLEENIKALIKPQYVDHIPRGVRGGVNEILTRKDERKSVEHLSQLLDLEVIKDRNIEALSGGELQRFAIAVTACQEANIYMFDEPSSYLDIKQRLKAAQAIRDLCSNDKYIIVVEHDLSVLDYLSDFVCCLYGKPGAYGVVTAPFSVREGINIFLAGFVPTENLRFRQTELSFRVAENIQAEDLKRFHNYKYPKMGKVLGDFKLTVEAGSFSESEIIVMLGQNGTGKTTFIRLLAGLLQPDSGDKVPALNVSYKPQKIAPKFEGTVRQLLHDKIRNAYVHPQFNADVMRPLMIEELMDQEVKNLSGGELQRLALTLALGKPADIYLIDEPSAYLDSEQRIHASKVIKRFILHAKKTAFIVEHDFIMATYLADRVVVYTGTPAKEAVAHSPQSLVTGMNAFLKDLEITFRRDPTNYRPRINKLNSVKDREQKQAGTYFYLDTDDDDDEPRSKKDAKKDAKKQQEVEREREKEAEKMQKAKERQQEREEELKREKEEQERERQKLMKKSALQKKKAQEEEDEEEEDEDEEEEEEAPKKPAKKEAPKKEKKEAKEDEDDDEEAEDDEDDDEEAEDDEDEDGEGSKKTVGAAPRIRGRKKRTNRSKGGKGARLMNKLLSD